MAKQKRKSNSPVPGPQPERLNLTGNWQAIMKKSLAKKKPKGGWPK